MTILSFYNTGRLLVLAVGICFSATAQDSYRYSVDLTQAANDRLKVELLCPAVTSAEINFYLPKIVPGTYMNSNFGKYVHDLKAFDKNGQELAVGRRDDNSWRISGATALYRLVYEVEDTWDATIDNMVYPMCGTNFEAGKNFVINTCGLFGYLEGLKKTGFELSFTKPTGFYAATGLRPVSSTSATDIFHCSNADELYDSPIMFSIPDTTTVKVGSTDVLVAVYSPRKLVSASFIAASLEKLLLGTKDYLKGKLPVDKYAFIFYFNGEQPALANTGAWEHSYSSFYSLDEEPQASAIGPWVDMASHEFFHIVTPLTISSKEVKEFNFNETVLSKHLWLYEGSTEYYAHHMQVWAGLHTPEHFLETLSSQISLSRMYFNDSLPFAELSKESAGKWHEQYINVYLKGAVISACLDLYLLQLSGGQYALRDLKHDLGVKFGKNSYFLDEELYDAIEGLSYPEIKQFLLTYVDGPTPIPYETYFALAGVDYWPRKTIQAITLGGVSIQPDEKEKLRISTKNINQFGRKMGYMENDELVSINGEPATAGNLAALLEKFTANTREGDSVVVVVRRKTKGNKTGLVTLAAPASKADKTIYHVLEFNKQPTAAQLKIRQAWLNHTSNLLASRADSADVNTIDAVVNALYSVISGPAGERDWNRFRSLFHADAYMGAINAKRELRKFSPEEYIQRNGPFFQQYSFHERELGRRVSQFGNIAQVFTSYEYKTGTPEPAGKRGINSIELVQEKGRWWIMSVTWDEETAAQPIPEKYLGF